ncbi:glutamate synthase [NADH] [Parelaphostrongylus tenuis]|uniref:Glutamate synthase [NADH] n=1 Tax=Parelaphostrongylus tenuis TaxID=148309 RepID=A0AAD5QSS9_PARTN|nr:glutamate synthase [NADH] [Parelaphostrongylus tenuis]
MDKVIMKIVMVIMWYSPLGILCLIMGKILEIDDLSHTARMLGCCMLTANEPHKRNAVMYTTQMMIGYTKKKTEQN